MLSVVVVLVLVVAVLFALKPVLLAAAHFTTYLVPAGQVILTGQPGNANSKEKNKQNGPANTNTKRGIYGIEHKQTTGQERRASKHEIWSCLPVHRQLPQDSGRGRVVAFVLPAAVLSEEFDHVESL